MGYELRGMAFLRAHHPLKSFKPFNMAIVFLEISTKEIIQKKKRGESFQVLSCIWENHL